MSRAVPVRLARLLLRRHPRKARLAPEYGGDGGLKVGLCASKRRARCRVSGSLGADLRALRRQPVPGAPIAAALSSRSTAPGIARRFHNGYDVVFQPFKDGEPAGDYEVFADGFAGPDKQPDRRSTVLFLGSRSDRRARSTSRTTCGAGSGASPSSGGTAVDERSLRRRPPALRLRHRQHRGRRRRQRACIPMPAPTDAAALPAPPGADRRAGGTR